MPPYAMNDNWFQFLFEAYDAWKPLANHIGVTNQRMRCMEKKENPAEQVLTEWEKKGTKVKHLYDALIECGCEALADRL